MTVCMVQSSLCSVAGASVESLSGECEYSQGSHVEYNVYAHVSTYNLLSYN